MSTQPWKRQRKKTTGTDTITVIFDRGNESNVKFGENCYRQNAILIWGRTGGRLSVKWFLHESQLLTEVNVVAGIQMDYT